MAERQAVKNDLSWHEKLEYIWCVLKYSKRMANWVVMNCEHCHHYELERLGKPIESDVGNLGNQKEFQQTYRCLHCGAIGIVTQIWVKECDEDGKEND